MPKQPNQQKTGRKTAQLGPNLRSFAITCREHDVECRPCCRRQNHAACSFAHGGEKSPRLPPPVNPTDRRLGVLTRAGQRSQEPLRNPKVDVVVLIVAHPRFALHKPRCKSSCLGACANSIW